MRGFVSRDWKGLKLELLNRFGKTLPLVKYTKQDLKNLVSAAAQKGGVNTLTEFKIFKTKFETITHYLVRMGYNKSLEEFRELLLEALSQQLEKAVMRELVLFGQIKSTKDGGKVLPKTNVLLSYIQKEVESASVLERQDLWNEDKAHKNSSKSSKTPEIKPKVERVVERVVEKPVPNSLEKQIQEITKQLAALTTGKMTPPHMASGSAPANAPYRRPDFRFYYCFQETHESNNCSVFVSDESSGRVGKRLLSTRWYAYSMEYLTTY